MNRKNFLKRLGIGTAAIVVAPKILADESIKGSMFTDAGATEWRDRRRDLYKPEFYFYNGDMVYHTKTDFPFVLIETENPTKNDWVLGKCLRPDWGKHYTDPIVKFHTSTLDKIGSSDFEE